MKKTLALALSLLLACLPLAGCGMFYPQLPEVPPDWTAETEAPQTVQTEPVGETISMTEPQSQEVVLPDEFDVRDRLAYVLIYDPDSYDESGVIAAQNADYNPTLRTGDFVDQLNPERTPVELETQSPLPRRTRRSLMADLSGLKLQPSGQGGSLNQPTFRLGENREFYAGGTKKEQFTCVYTGANCCAWIADGDFDQDMIKRISREVDRTLLPAVIEQYGEPRFYADGGKVSLLFHNDDSQAPVWFWPAELYTPSELKTADADAFGINREGALLHVNTRRLGDPEDADNTQLLYAALVRELQHLVSATDAFYSANGLAPASWLDESMSAWAAETMYPGAAGTQGDVAAFYDAAAYRTGLSLLNFSVAEDEPGAYGAAALFAQYLTELAGEDAFYRLHQAYRDKENPVVGEAQAIYRIMPEIVAADIDQAYVYPSSLRFSTPEQQWLSKLMLDFTLRLLQTGKAGLPLTAGLDPHSLIYDVRDPAELQGAGHVLLATVDGHYVIPSDADHGLLYLGLNEQFQPVTQLIYR